MHWLRDKHSGIYNYDPKISKVLDVDLFDYSALPPYLTSSKDPELLKITKKQGKRFCGSTSSLTGLLSHCYYLLSRWKEPELHGFSPSFSEMPTGFSEGAKLPVSVRLQYQSDGDFYAIDADKGSDGALDNSNYVLTSLGKSLEKYLTVSLKDYALYERINSHKLSKKARDQQEAYHYAQTSKFLMRSQLDCADPRLPKQTFDLKTRACVSIRHDRANYAENSGYQVLHATGLWESFEREYWDMVRAAFLKYNFQARIGNMDGIFVAYHNTSQIFGFQYITLEEMSVRLFGSEQMGELAYRLSLGLLEKVLEAATEHFPKQSVGVTLETRAGASAMNVLVQNADQTQIMQFDVTMDRYLNDALVRGPVNPAGINGALSDAQLEEVRTGRSSQTNLSELTWHVDYCIMPRYDLSTTHMQSNLQDVRQRQQALQSMCVPNIQKLNEREGHRVDVLAKRPQALTRFLEERENGRAIGMPRAPGQLTTREVMQRKGMPSAKTVPKPAHVPEHTEIHWQRIPDPTTRRLRELSRQGQQEHGAQKASDTHTLYHTL